MVDNMYNYNDEELLLLSGIQHFAFCERQWAFIHMEQQWMENTKTIEGKYIHQRVDNPLENETRRDIRITRSVPVISKKLGLQGVADVVEFILDNDAPELETVVLEGRYGRWRVTPIEYKRGKPKKDDRDIVQLCAQAIALEEMLKVKITKGYLYYHEIRRRSEIIFEESVRTRAEDLASRMHSYITNNCIPRAKKAKHCSQCSLYEICQPDWSTGFGNVQKYLRETLYEED
ncbi:MAG: CRISPR-associated protein Cas4 [Clostridia bacterium]|nr:CRISPR-associated protein Cas4 [Clostridia bacterium]